MASGYHISATPSPSNLQPRMKLKPNFHTRHRDIPSRRSILSRENWKLDSSKSSLFSYFSIWSLDSFYNEFEIKL